LRIPEPLPTVTESGGADCHRPKDRLPAAAGCRNRHAIIGRLHAVANTIIGQLLEGGE